MNLRQSVFFCIILLLFWSIVFENMVLRRIFVPRSDEVTGVMEETA